MVVVDIILFILSIAAMVGVLLFLAVMIAMRLEKGGWIGWPILFIRFLRLTAKAERNGWGPFLVRRRNRAGDEQPAFDHDLSCDVDERVYIFEYRGGANLPKYRLYLKFHENIGKWDYFENNTQKHVATLDLLRTFREGEVIPDWVTRRTDFRLPHGTDITMTSAKVEPTVHFASWGAMISYANQLITKRPLTDEVDAQREPISRRQNGKFYKGGDVSFTEE